MLPSKLLRELGIGAVPHDFRSSFRDWAAERTDVPREVCELALAHVNSDRVEAAYRRSDLFDRRRELIGTGPTTLLLNGLTSNPRVGDLLIALGESDPHGCYHARVRTRRSMTAAVIAPYALQCRIYMLSVPWSFSRTTG